MTAFFTHFFDELFLNQKKKRQKNHNFSIPAILDIEDLVLDTVQFCEKVRDLGFPLILDTIISRLGWTYDHLQENCLSICSFAKEQSIHMLICKRPDLPDEQLQMAGPPVCLFAKGRPLRMIIFKWPNPVDDHLQKTRSSR